MNDPITPAPKLLVPSGDSFRHKLTVTTFGLLFIVVAIYLLEKFQKIFQPLLIAVLCAYVLLPIHGWLVKRRVPSHLAFAIILTLLLALFVGMGFAVYGSVTSLEKEQ